MSNIKTNTIFKVGLNIFATGLIGLSVFYWIRLISQNLWDELPMRIIIMILMIGAVCCFGIAKILHNQNEILKRLENANIKS